MLLIQNYSVISSLTTHFHGGMARVRLTWPAWLPLRSRASVAVHGHRIRHHSKNNHEHCQDSVSLPCYPMSIPGN
jgi:hypothetical protein